MAYLPYDEWKETPEGKAKIASALDEADVRAEFYSEQKRLRDEGEDIGEEAPKYYPDRSKRYAAALESCPHVHIDGLCQMWGNWSSLLADRLPNLVHGFKMCAPISAVSEEYYELSFLCDVASLMEVENVAD